MAQADVYPRFASSLLEDALADTPVVLVHGPRQSGKTTLARMVGENHGYAYVTFDDDTQLAAATIDPAGFVANLPVKVDVILERGVKAVAGIEVKASATVTASDFRGIRKLKAATGTRFAAGVVLYDGENVVRFGDDLFAVPIRGLWEDGKS